MQKRLGGVTFHFPYTAALLQQNRSSTSSDVTSGTSLSSTETMVFTQSRHQACDAFASAIHSAGHLLTCSMLGSVSRIQRRKGPYVVYTGFSNSIKPSLVFLCSPILFCFSNYTLASQTMSNY